MPERSAGHEYIAYRSRYGEWRPSLFRAAELDNATTNDCRFYIYTWERSGWRTLYLVAAILEMSLPIKPLNVSRLMMSGVGLANGTFATWPLKQKGTRSCVLHRTPHMRSGS